jgi:hypothetical protein
MMNVDATATSSTTATLIGIGGGDKDHVSTTGAILSVLIGDYANCCHAAVGTATTDAAFNQHSG